MVSVMRIAQGVQARIHRHLLDPLQDRRLGIDPRRFVFVDLGSGKGRALLRAALRPFRRVEGIELSQAMHAIALLNIAQAEAAGKARAPIAAHCLDVADYALPQEPLVLYLFNSFRETVLDQGLARLEASLREHPRDCYFIYLNPAHRHCFDRHREFQPVRRPGMAGMLDRLISPWPLIIYRYLPEDHSVQRAS